MTPFGIYNERHDATPTILSTKLPHSIYDEHVTTTGDESRCYAKFSNGVQILGNLFIDRWSGKYQLYIGNGRGSNASEKDDNANKGVGARLDISTPITGLRFGASYYADENGLNADIWQSSLAFDLEFDFDNTHFESEIILTTQDRFDSLEVPTGDFRKGYGVYFQLSHRMFDRLTPLARFEYERHDLDVDDNNNVLTIGLNYSFTAKVYLKNEIHFHEFGSNVEPGYEMYVSSIAVAF